MLRSVSEKGQEVERSDWLGLAGKPYKGEVLKLFIP